MTVLPFHLGPVPTKCVYFPRKHPHSYTQLKQNFDRTKHNTIACVRGYFLFCLNINKLIIINWIHLMSFQWAAICSLKNSILELLKQKDWELEPVWKNSKTCKRVKKELISFYAEVCVCVYAYHGILHYWLIS